MRTVESYDIDKNVEILKEAWEYAKDHEEPAVVIFTHPCMLLRQEQPKILVRVNDDTCIGCKFCINFFNCPGLAFDENSKKAFIDERYCVKCGVCTNVCLTGLLRSYRRREDNAIHHRWSWRQGILFTSRVLGKIALKRGENTIGSEEHGMAQRGGSVISHFKIGPYKSPLISVGDADILLAFDQNEGIRNLHFLNDGGHSVINVHKREAFQNENLKKYLTKRNISTFLLNGYEILDKHMGGNYLFLNVLILGAMSALGIGGICFEEIERLFQA